MTAFRLRHRRHADYVSGEWMTGTPGEPGFARLGRILMRASQFEDFKRACAGIEFSEESYQREPSK